MAAMKILLLIMIPTNVLTLKICEHLTDQLPINECFVHEDVCNTYMLERCLEFCGLCIKGNSGVSIENDGQYSECKDGSKLCFIRKRECNTNPLVFRHCGQTCNSCGRSFDSRHDTLTKSPPLRHWSDSSSASSAYLSSTTLSGTTYSNVIEEQASTTSDIIRSIENESKITNSQLEYETSFSNITVVNTRTTAALDSHSPTLSQLPETLEISMALLSTMESKHESTNDDVTMKSGPYDKESSVEHLKLVAQPTTIGSSQSPASSNLSELRVKWTTDLLANTEPIERPNTEFHGQGESQSDETSSQATFHSTISLSSFTTMESQGMQPAVTELEKPVEKTFDLVTKISNTASTYPSRTTESSYSSVKQEQTTPNWYIEFLASGNKVDHIQTTEDIKTFGPYIFQTDSSPETDDQVRKDMLNIMKSQGGAAFTYPNPTIASLPQKDVMRNLDFNSKLRNVFIKFLPTMSPIKSSTNQKDDIMSRPTQATQRSIKEVHSSISSVSQPPKISITKQEISSQSVTPAETFEFAARMKLVTASNADTDTTSVPAKSDIQIVASWIKDKWYIVLVASLVICSATVLVILYIYRIKYQRQTLINREDSPVTSI